MARGRIPQNPQVRPGVPGSPLAGEPVRPRFNPEGRYGVNLDFRTRAEERGGADLSRIQAKPGSSRGIPYTPGSPAQPSGSGGSFDLNAFLGSLSSANFFGPQQAFAGGGSPAMFPRVGASAPSTEGNFLDPGASDLFKQQLQYNLFAQLLPFLSPTDRMSGFNQLTGLNLSGSSANPFDPTMTSRLGVGVQNFGF